MCKSVPEVKVGLFPMQVLSLLQSIVPRRRGRRVVPDEAEPFAPVQALDAG